MPTTTAWRTGERWFLPRESGGKERTLGRGWKNSNRRAYGHIRRLPLGREAGGSGPLASASLHSRFLTRLPPTGIAQGNLLASRLFMTPPNDAIQGKAVLRRGLLGDGLAVPLSSMRRELAVDEAHVRTGRALSIGEGCRFAGDPSTTFSETQGTPIYDVCGACGHRIRRGNSKFALT